MRSSTARLTACRALAALLGLAMAGCRQDYQSETVVDPDGKVSRAIYQPEEETPDAVRDPKRWDHFSFAPTPDVLERGGWPPSIKRFPALEASPANGHGYFVAWGKFESPRDLPDHVVMKPLTGARVPEGRLVRDYSRNDYVLVVEHRWTETLTDCVTFDDMRQARKELLELMIDVEAEVFDAEFGKEYDASGLATWLKTEGSAWVEESTDLLFARATQEELARVAERHGLSLLRDGHPLKDEAQNKVIETFAIDLIAKTVRHRDGRPLSREQIDALRDWIKSSEPQDPVRERLESAKQKVIAQKYGGEKAFDERVATLLNRVFGLYLVRILDPSAFTCTLTLPGVIVETNGTILSTNRVRWQFDAKEAYPSGYPMKCRSIEPDKTMQEWLEGKPLESRESMLQFVRLVEGQERLINALRESGQRKSFKPLSQYRDALSSDPHSVEEVVRLYGLIKLLKIRLD